MGAPGRPQGFTASVRCDTVGVAARNGDDPQNSKPSVIGRGSGAASTTFTSWYSEGCAGRNHTWTTAVTVPIEVRVA
jgi:hypothetical protein